MRWIVFVLIFVNTGYFAWSIYQQSRAGYETVSDSSKPIPKTGRRLVLVSESDLRPAAKERVPEKTASVTVNLNKTAEPITAESVKKCLTLGPFENADTVDQVQQRLFSLGINSRERAERKVQAADFWVHIPPLPSRDSAIRLLRELQAQKIDSFVITQGELANGISLGLFSKEQSANTVSRRLIAAGYNVEVKALSRVPERWWLEMKADDEDTLDNYFWSELISRMPDIKKEKKRCEGIASEN